MTSATRKTVDHDEIRAWVTRHGGRPATVGNAGREGVGQLRIDFPGASKESLEPIAWGPWFERFDEQQLAFLYQTEEASGEDSMFFRFVHR